MIKSSGIDQFVQQILTALPDDLHHAREDIRKNVKSSVRSALGRLDLVTREEFDVQADLLSRTRALLDEMQQRVEELEKQHQNKPRDI